MKKFNLSRIFSVIALLAFVFNMNAFAASPAIDDLTLEELLSEIHTRSEGMVYTTQIQAPVTEFLATKPNGGMLTSANFLRAIGRPPLIPITEISYQSWIAPLVANDTNGKWTAMNNLLASNIDVLTVFKVGTGSVDFYIVGLHDSGYIVGIYTYGVE